MSNTTNGASERLDGAVRAAEDGLGRAAGSVRNAFGSARDQVEAKVENWGDDIEGELRHLRRRVDRLMRDRVNPAIDSAAATAGDYAQQARDAVVHQSDRAAAAVQERPLLAMLAVGTVGWLVGYLSSGRAGEGRKGR